MIIYYNFSNGLHFTLHTIIKAIAKVVVDYHIPIITITSSSKNIISQMSDIVLDYGQSDENEMRMGANITII
jgi:DNA-binding MurR/RpiR family transcriptional regulator